jgi:hypothetical protein
METIKIVDGSKLAHIGRVIGHYGYKNYPTWDVFYATAGYIIEHGLDPKNEADRRTARTAIKEMVKTGRHAEGLDLIKKHNYR